MLQNSETQARIRCDCKKVLRLERISFYSVSNSSLDNVRQIIRHVVLALCVLASLIGTVSAQNERATRSTARKSYDEAERLREQQTKESLLQAIEKYQEATNLFHSINDFKSEAYALHNMGFAYASLGENQKALDCYLQSLSLKRM